ncbi:hypothetical protein C8N43_1307 [Litoreibacter ponti]|uniref:Acetolactate synthase n=1 Tax=Litoreibacter ponti TaxID=1510457 RepID=A0A2T6BKQ3_9RHOB|nr:DUF6497 family protein [Litoreibacter ponti]PTX56647.1 hypothetical protein C8N43_1307 [Litoreibacter ponti]
MMRAVAILAALSGAASAQDLGSETLRGPSGVTYALHEMRFEPDGAYEAARRTVRLRFVAPKLEDNIRYGFAVIEADFQALCDEAAVPAARKFAPNAREIVISVASEPRPFGETAPNVVQYFDLFRFSGDTCIWEGL